jgi:hypothetical protein
MAIIETVRLLLKKYTSGGDPHPTRAEFNTMIDTLENNVGMYSQGITSARPAAGKIGRTYWDTEVGRLYYDDGVQWRDLNPNGGGGAGAKVTPGVNGIEGVSSRAARADHTHRLDLATSAIDGALSAADKAKLDAATSGATANALARRDANARLSVNTPVDPFHATTKGYVDGLNVETADYVDEQVGPGLTVTNWTPLAIPGFTLAGKIQSVPFANKTLVIGNVDIIRPAGSSAFAVAGGNVLYNFIGTFIPTELREVSATAVSTVTNLQGGAAYQKIQTTVQPGTGRVGVRSDDVNGLSWGANAQISVAFTYFVEAVVV